MKFHLRPFGLFVLFLSLVLSSPGLACRFFEKWFRRMPVPEVASLQNQGEFRFPVGPIATESTLSWNTYRWKEPLKTVPPELLARVSKVRGGRVSREAFALHFVVYDGKQKSDRDGRVDVLFEDTFLGNVDFFLRNGSLTLWVKTEEKFRPTKLYPILLREVLRICPQTNQIPLKAGISSTNAQVVVDRVFGGRGKKPSVHTAEERRELRRRILEVLPQIPAVKARIRNGFARITGVRVSTMQLLRLQSERGDALPSDEINVVVADGENTYSLRANGEIGPASDEAMFTFPDYVDPD